MPGQWRITNGTLTLICMRKLPPYFTCRRRRAAFSGGRRCASVPLFYIHHIRYDLSNFISPEVVRVKCFVLRGAAGRAADPSRRDHAGHLIEAGTRVIQIAAVIYSAVFPRESITYRTPTSDLRPSKKPLKRTLGPMVRTPIISHTGNRPPAARRTN